VDQRSKPIFYKGIPAPSGTVESVARDEERESQRPSVNTTRGEFDHHSENLSVEFVDEEQELADKLDDGEGEETDEYDVDVDVNSEPIQA
jgi:hypothetical protein